MVNRKLRNLVAAGIIGWSFVQPFTAWAADGAGFTKDAVSSDGKSMFELFYANQGVTFSLNPEKAKRTIVAGKNVTYTLDGKMKDNMRTGLSYWADMLAPGSKNTQPHQILIYGSNRNNASAMSHSYEKGKEIESDVKLIMSKLQDGVTTVMLTDPTNIEKTAPGFADRLNGLSVIEIGNTFGADREGAKMGWWMDAETSIPTNEQAADYIGTVRHEMGHALGLSPTRRGISDEDYNKKDEIFGSYGKYITIKQYEEEDFDGKKSIETYYSINNDSSEELEYFIADTPYTRHLYDQNGQQARAGQFIVSSKTYNGLKEQGGAEINPEDFFVLDTDKQAYFKGDNVAEVLDGAVLDGTDMKNVLPINGWEGKIQTAFNPELAHLQTAGMMSHRPYTNYTGFMEVELAVMQDLGYKLDRKNYFGYSLYRDGETLVNRNGYSARNAEGTAYIEGKPNETPLGVGLHVYGRNNNVTQAADILTKGAGAVGIRVDGTGNTVTVDKDVLVQSDGRRGIGVLYAYGSKQNLNVDGTVTAKDKEGNALQFDFGSSSNGASDEYRGSYIRFKRGIEAETNSINYSENLPLTGQDKNGKEVGAEVEALNGEMLSSVNINGTVEGGKNAIYIGKNAFVRDINFNKGAVVKGDITSDWKHFGEEYTGDRSYDNRKRFGEESKGDKSYDNEAEEGNESLQLQYSKGRYAYRDYIPALVTNLNVKGNLDYAGTISGTDNLKLNVRNGGRLYMTGSADIVSATVEEGGSLYGGTYKLNEQTVAKGFEDGTTGKFINEGTIGPRTPDKEDSHLKIEGELVNSGELSFTANGDKLGKIEVEGEFTDKGSTLIVDNDGSYTPEKTYSTDFVYENGSVKKLAWKNKEEYSTGMLTANYGENTVTFNRENNLDTDDGEIIQGYNAIDTMFESMKAGEVPDRRGELSELYNLNAATARKTLKAINGMDNARFAAVMQKNNVMGRVISSRLNAAWAADKLAVKTGTNNLVEDKNGGVTMDVPVKVATEYSGWAKVDKNWGSVGSDADYKSQSVTIGWDKKVAKSWRLGFFGNYGSGSYSSDYSSNETKNGRVGLYGGFHRGADDGFVYLDYGWGNNTMRRSLSALGMQTRGDFHSRIIELGGEYKHDLHANDGKTWHVSPFINTQLSRYSQNAYDESGAGVYNQSLDSLNNTYWGMEAGMEFKRELHKGSYAFRMGYKRGLTGVNPRLNFHYEGDPLHGWSNEPDSDRSFLILSLGGDYEFAPQWTLSGEASMERGAHDRNYNVALMVRKVW